ncbi:gamma-aminobutyric acid receptor subunit beta-like [Brevipalpus obovatus]|uniref:gamma-aminobutyric acid receptor subunit beta-like n=1 Tax=Brevipalpus obovatus TaxID=246614 RepID=UPI003D9EF766
MGLKFDHPLPTQSLGSLLPIIVSLLCLLWQISAQSDEISDEGSYKGSSEPDLDDIKGNKIGRNITNILNEFFKNNSYDSYDPRVRPFYGGDPVEIGVTMHIIGISSVSEVQMDFTCDMYFRQYWTDPRLKFNATEKINALYVGAEVADRIWVPDTFFANEKSASFHYATTKNTFLRIGNTGSVMRSIRLTVTASCPMKLQYFPMDHQECSLEIESYGYDVADMRYQWKNSVTKPAVVVASNLTLPQFKVVGHKQSNVTEATSTGNYSRLKCSIHFARSLGFYLIQIYIPASLIVVISWVSFWLHRNATPARVSLGVTTVLTMTTLMSSTNSQLPKISYIKSIDVYLGTCFVMVFASLVEYATVGYLGKRIAMRKSRVEQLNKVQEEQRKRATQPTNTNQATSNPMEPHVMCQPQVQPHSHIGRGYPSGPPGSMAGHPHQPPPPPPGTCDLPPPGDHGHHGPMNPGEMGIVNPNVCPARNPRPIVYKHSHLHHPGSGGGTLHRNGHFEHGPYCSSPPTGHRNTCTSMRPCGGQHVICGHPDNSAGIHFPNEARYKMVDSKGGGPRGISIDTPSTTPLIPRRSMEGVDTPTTPLTPASPKVNPRGTNLNKLLGVSPSDIDKYSRVIFPVCFTCFNLMYWIIYLHIANESAPKDGSTHS